MSLKFEVKTQRIVDYNDLDRFINESFPQFKGQYECVPYEEWNNDSSHNIHVEPKISEYNLKDIDEMLTTGKIKSYRTRDLLCYLCERGDLMEGDYLIEVSW